MAKLAGEGERINRLGQQPRRRYVLPTLTITDAQNPSQTEDDNAHNYQTITGAQSPSPFLLGQHSALFADASSDADTREQKGRLESWGDRRLEPWRGAERNDDAESSIYRCRGRRPNLRAAPSYCTTVPRPIGQLICFWTLRIRPRYKRSLSRSAERILPYTLVRPCRSVGPAELAICANCAPALSNHDPRLLNTPLALSLHSTYISPP